MTSMKEKIPWWTSARNLVCWNIIIPILLNQKVMKMYFVMCLQKKNKNTKLIFIWMIWINYWLISRKYCIKGNMKLAVLQMTMVLKLLACQNILRMFLMENWQIWQTIVQTLRRMYIYFIKRLIKLSTILIIFIWLTMFYLISPMNTIRITQILQLNQSLTSMRHFRSLTNWGKYSKDMLT